MLKHVCMSFIHVVWVMKNVPWVNAMSGKGEGRKQVLERSHLWAVRFLRFKARTRFYFLKCQVGCVSLGEAALGSVLVTGHPVLRELVKKASNSRDAQAKCA